jgi:hypothetical protein
MSFYDSDSESEPTSLRSSSTEHEELVIPPPKLPPRPSVLPTLPHSPLFIGERFPWPEGQQFEFKETWGACTTSKMHETICAFLNSAGGYLIYGIQDSGKLLGISREEADKILLRADDIYHTKKIVHIETGKELTPSCVRGSIVRLCTTLHTATGIQKPKPTERFLAILTIRSLDHNNTYRMICGDIIIRLSASNFRSKSTTLSTYEEIIRENRHLEAEKTKYYHERNRFRKEFMIMESSHRELSIRLKESMVDISAARMEAQVALDLLHTRILADKADAERRLGRGWFC